MTIKAGIVGLGAIGMGYDTSGAAAAILTHAKAFSLHPAYQLCVGVDDDPQRVEAFTREYCSADLNAVSHVNQMFETPLDVVAISTPTATHEKILRQCSAENLRAVLCEKPLAPSLTAAKNIVSLARERRWLLAVNFFRRFEPGTQALRVWLGSAEFGQLVSGVVWYKRGLLNNASHFIDLLIYFFGEPDQIGFSNRTMSWPQAQKHLTAADEDADLERFCLSEFFLAWGGAKVTFCEVDNTQYNFFEMQLIGSTGKVSYTHGGATIQCHTMGLNDLSGRASLSPVSPFEKADFYRYQYHVVDALARALTMGDALVSTGETALRSVALICALHALVVNERGEQ